MKKIYALSFFFFGMYQLHSQQIVTDRPDQTEASSTVEPSQIQVEAGVLIMNEQPDSRTEVRSSAIPNALFRVGLFNHFELRVVTQMETVKILQDGIETFRDFGFSNLEVGFKVQFTEEKEGVPEIGFLTHLVCSTGSNSFNDSSFGSINKLAITHTFSETHSLAYNIGYDYLGTGNGDLFYSLAWGITLSEKVGMYLEPYGFIRNIETWEASADAGFVYFPIPTIQLDYSFGLGLNHRMNYQSVGISFRLPN